MSCENCGTDKCSCDKAEEEVKNVNIVTAGLLQINNYIVKVKKLKEDVQLPTRGSAAAAGYDVYAAIDKHINIGPHGTAMIPTGLSFELPEGSFLAIYPRSGLASKEGLRPANCVGVVDSDYRGEVKVALHNDSNETRTVEPGERIAQFILQSYIPMIFEEVKELSDTERGQGGFGSTGTTTTTTKKSKKK